jgi:hypothetical protein
MLQGIVVELEVPISAACLRGSGKIARQAEQFEQGDRLEENVITRAQVQLVEQTTTGSRETVDVATATSGTAGC